MRILLILFAFIPSVSYAQTHVQQKSHAELQETFKAATAEAEQEADVADYSNEDFIVDLALPEVEEDQQEYIEDFENESVDKIVEEEVVPGNIAVNENYTIETDNIGFLPIPEHEKDRDIEEKVPEEYEGSDRLPYELELEQLDQKKSIESYIFDLHIEDPQILNVSVVNDVIHFRYTNAAKMLGLIPIRFEYFVHIEDDSTFTIEEPWWLLFVSDRLAIFKRELGTALSTIADETETEERQRQTLRLMGTVSKMIQGTDIK